MVEKKSNVIMSCFKFGIGLPYSESNHLNFFKMTQTLGVSADNHFPGLPRLL